MKVILRPYWSFATMGFSEMNLLQYIVSHPGTLKTASTAVCGGAGSYVNSFRLTVNGRGMMRTMNRAISDMRRRKTWGDD